MPRRAAHVTSGLERWRYDALPHQLAFHHSTARYRLLGGAAGPGKTLALIMDHMFGCAQFSAQDAPQVHTLLLRRTYPKLRDTVITRFLEKVPREFYREFNKVDGVVTWPNGATTKFGSMQHEHDVWGYQGQWWKIGYDELTEFTFKQWQNIAAWNRCPVSPYATKDGATNPIGIGAQWVESLFVKHTPCVEMEANQSAQYNPDDYAYFPATYLDNPTYATDANFIAGLESYQEGVAKALKLGIWGVAGGYFDGAWDEAENVYQPEYVQLQPWWKRWLGGDWGFDHNSAIHWLCLDDFGIVRIYHELIVNKLEAEQLGEMIARESFNIDGNQPKYELFSFAHDSFAQKQDENPIGLRMGRVLTSHGLVAPSPSTKDKKGREQILYDKLRSRIITGHTNDGQPISQAALQISSACPNLIATIPKAPRDEDDRETIAEFLGDDSLQSSGYGLYAWFGRPARKPISVRVQDRIAAVQAERIQSGLLPQHDPTMIAMMAQKAEAAERKHDKPVPLITRGRWQRRMRPF
jgi:hypothetical protein